MVRKLGVTHSKFKNSGKHIVSLKLSLKILNTAERLYHTFLHELCHVANVLIDNVRKAGHGPAWQHWTNKASRVFPNIDKITRLNKKVRVKYRYVYSCERCKKRICRRQCRPSLTFRLKMQDFRSPCCRAKIELNKS